MVGGIKELFCHNRFPIGWKIISLIIYLPVGLLLAMMRLFIGFHVVVAASLLHQLPAFRAIVLRVMCTILGIVVLEENEHNRDESVKVIVTNHVSPLDHIAIHLVTGSVSVSVWDLPSIFHYPFSYKNLGRPNEKELLVRNVKKLIENGEVVDIQPENGITSGERGLLRFSTWPCCLSHSVQPASIRLWRPPSMEVMPSVISASWSSDIFWFLFVPFTVFKIRYLRVLCQSECQSPEMMSKVLQARIASDLGIAATSFTYTEKAEYEKRLNAEKSIPMSTTYSSSVDVKNSEMALKIQEVLPDVPMIDICLQLMKYKTVDLTIAKLLEECYDSEGRWVGRGRSSSTVKSSSSPSSPSSTSTPSPSSSSSPPPPATAASGPSTSTSSSSSSFAFDATAKTFPKCARDRMISFQERKLRLIESARQRYIEKHALNIMNSS